MAIASGEDEDEDEDDDFDQTDIQKTELTKKAVYASPNVIIGGVVQYLRRRIFSQLMAFQYKICRYLRSHEITAYVEQGVRH